MSTQPAQNASTTQPTTGAAQGAQKPAAAKEDPKHKIPVTVKDCDMEAKSKDIAAEAAILAINKHEDTLKIAQDVSDKLKERIGGKWNVIVCQKEHNTGTYCYPNDKSYKRFDCGAYTITIFQTNC